MINQASKKTDLNSERGITLITLTITIIILVILASITVGVAFGDNGLINGSEKIEQVKRLEKYRTTIEGVAYEQYTDYVMEDKVGSLRDKTKDKIKTLEFVKEVKDGIEDDEINIITNESYLIVVKLDNENTDIIHEGEYDNEPLPKIARSYEENDDGKYIITASATVEKTEKTTSITNLKLIETNNTIENYEEGKEITFEVDKPGKYWIEATTNVGKIIKEPIVVKSEIEKGAFIKYNVEYTDTYMGYEYTSINGWRLENYDLGSDGKTLTNVRLISTGMPARMYYSYNDTTNNCSKWVTDSKKLETFKNNVLGTEYTTYIGSDTYYSLQASAGLYYNLGKMTFEQGTVYNAKNQGYYTKVKNKNTTYTSGETTGSNLFVARDDVNIRILTLPEVNKANKEIIEATGIKIQDTTGIYRLDSLSTGTGLKDKIYDTGDSWYWLASPSPDKNNNSIMCNTGSNGLISGHYESWLAIRPLICIKSKIKLEKKQDDTGFVYYEMVDVN